MSIVVTASAGVFFHAVKTNRLLYLLRADSRTAGTWGLPGGKINPSETLMEGIKRECLEEIQFFPLDAKLIPIQKFTNNSFVYHTFFCDVDEEFVPMLNEEHTGYAWVNAEVYPRPLHPGLFNTINFDIVQTKMKALMKKAA